MNIAVFGGTGGTGQWIIKLGIEAGHQITALVRNPDRLDDGSSQTKIIVGNVLDYKKVQESIAGTDAVAVSLGSRSDSPDNIVSQGTQNIIRAMKALDVRRLVVITSLGVGDSKDQVPMAFKLVMKTIMRKIIIDKDRQEQFVRASGLDWVIIRPGELSNDPPTQQYIFGTDPTITAKRVSRADVAEFVIQNLTDNQFLHQAVAIT
jgi:putative NADH-flavin reductase